MATQRQIKLAKLIRENYGVKGSTKTLQKLLLEAGYSENTAKSDAKIILATEGIREENKEFIESLSEKRDEAISQLDEGKLKKSSGRDLAYIVDVLTKNIQLLSGGATENVQVKEDHKIILDILKQLQDRND